MNGTLSRYALQPVNHVGLRRSLEYNQAKKATNPPITVASTPNWVPISRASSQGLSLSAVFRLSPLSRNLSCRGSRESFINEPIGKGGVELFREYFGIERRGISELSELPEEARITIEFSQTCECQ